MIIAAIVAASAASRESRRKRQTKDESAAARLYNSSSDDEMEPIDSKEDVSYVPLTFSKPKGLDCCNCFRPLSSIVFQCDYGHMACSTCRYKLSNKCRKCSSHITLMHGCTDKIIYAENRNHEEEYIHKPRRRHCLFSGCNYVASSELEVYMLSSHFIHKHGDFQIKFSYGQSFDVSLKSNDKIIILQEINDGKLFILSNNTAYSRNAVSICCINSNSSVHEYSYDILACSQKYTLRLQSFAKNVRQFTSTNLSSEFLVIPFDSSKPLKLQICITSPVIQFYIVSIGGSKNCWRLNISNKIVDVKKMVSDKKKIVNLHDDPMYNIQHLIFDGKLLDNERTLAYYNIKNDSHVHCALRRRGY